MKNEVIHLSNSLNVSRAKSSTGGKILYDPQNRISVSTANTSSHKFSTKSGQLWGKKSVASLCTIISSIEKAL